VALNTWAVVGEVLMVCHVWSPRKNVVLSAVPEASRAVAIVPEVILLAAKSGMRAASNVPLDTLLAAKLLTVLFAPLIVLFVRV